MKGIYSRGYLPHWDFAGAVQAVTFRLVDSVPLSVIRDWKRELVNLSDDHVRGRELHRRVSRYEDAGHGSAVLRREDCACIVQECLLAGHAERYQLMDWCVMPNHVHVMVRLGDQVKLSEVIQRWKGGSAVGINRVLGSSGRLWQREYYDRFIRDMDHFHDCRSYIRNNPVKAGLCKHPEDWKFSSAGMNWKI